MKKIIALAIAAIALSSCGMGTGKNNIKTFKYDLIQSTCEMPSTRILLKGFDHIGNESVRLEIQQQGQGCQIREVGAVLITKDTFSIGYLDKVGECAGDLYFDRVYGVEHTESGMVLKNNYCELFLKKEEIL